MTRQLYNLGIKFYTSIIHVASIFNTKAKLWVGGRKNIFNLLENKTETNKKYTWFHCSSLGEFEQARPLIETLKINYQKNIIVTFFSPSGYEIRKDYDGADIICYLPPDTIKNAKEFLSVVNVEMAFFIKYEFWFNYINELHKNNIPLYLVSGVFRGNQLFFKPYGKWFKKHLKYFNYFFLQNKNSLEILKSNNISNCIITGDTRFDRVIETLKQNEELKAISKFKNKRPLVVLGSSWKEEEIMFNEFLKTQKKPLNFKIIIAPHDVSVKHINQIKQLYKNEKVAIYSEIKCYENYNILIIDSIGLLSRIYKYADIAFIGGAFGSGLHNILEPAVFGVPMIFGPKINRFQEAVDLTSIKASFRIKNQIEFNDKIALLLENTELRKEKANLLKTYVSKNTGATDKIKQTIKF